MTEIKDILKLTVIERLHLVQTIWDSISKEVEEGDISDDHKVILNDRLESYKKDPKNNISWEVVDKKVRKGL